MARYTGLLTKKSRRYGVDLVGGGGDVVEQRPALLRRQLARVGTVLGVRATVPADQLAGPGDLPDGDHGAFAHVVTQLPDGRSLAHACS